MIYSQQARSAAAAIAILGLMILFLLVYLRLQIPETIGEALSYLSQYFTILTNALVVLSLGAIATGSSISPSIIRALVIAIACVGIIYHAVLAHLLDLSGLDLLADHGVHTVVPLLAVWWWLRHAPKPANRVADVCLWVIWPVIYCAYVLVRAVYSGFYPYPFLNLPELGWNGLAINIIGLLIAFVIVGLALVGLGKVFGRQTI
jgi:hypothetical protein